MGALECVPRQRFIPVSCLGYCHPEDSQAGKGCRERKKEGKGAKREEEKRKPR